MHKEVKPTRKKEVLAHIYVDKTNETLYHSAIQVYGELEWSYSPGEGVFSLPPKTNPNFKFYKCIKLGITCLCNAEVKNTLELLRERWPRNLNTFSKENSNDFCDDFCAKLGVSPLPAWLNRLDNADYDPHKTSGITSTISEDYTMSLRDETNPTELKKFLLVSRLSFSVQPSDVETCFGRFGKVSGVCFLTDNDQMFSRSCIVKMASQDDTNKILNLETQLHIILGIQAHVSKYDPMSLKDISKGMKLKMSIKDIDYTSENFNSDQKVVKFLEVRLQEIYYTEISLRKTSGRFYGEVEMSFIDEKARQEAKDLCMVEGWPCEEP